MVLEKKSEMKKPIVERSEELSRIESHWQRKRNSLAPLRGIGEVGPEVEAVVLRMLRRGKGKSSLEKLLQRHAKELLS